MFLQPLLTLALGAQQTKRGDRVQAPGCRRLIGREVRKASFKVLIAQECDSLCKNENVICVGLLSVFSG